MITHHTQLLQALIDKHGLVSYIEIGLQNADNNFNKIKCPVKCSVDPDPKAKAFFDCTSDEFFKVNHNVWDLIFLDGLHTAEQVKKDFDNSLRCLSDNGFIVIHDCLPKFEETTKVPRQTRCWHGTVYQFCMTLGNYDGIDWVTYNIDEGCMLIQKSQYLENAKPEIEPNWKNYQKFGRQLLNVVDEVII